MVASLRRSACCRPSGIRITFSRFSAIFAVFVPHFYLHCTHCVIPEILLNRLSSFCGGMLKLNANFDADSLFYLLSHFEHDSHTVHTITQQRLPPPLTSTVKLLFTHVHSSPLSLAPKLHQCHTIHCWYINNGCAFFGQISLYIDFPLSAKS